jgi:SAM-dependent methyltransferase
MAEAQRPLVQHDFEVTLANRERLQRNPNLLYWYKRLYTEMFGADREFLKKSVLEVGSGSSPLKRFFPNVITSDILNLEYLDVVLDCHQIAEFEGINNYSLDIITLTNVLHHLQDPLKFLQSATIKLKPGGVVYMVEPYLSLMSYPMYKLLHHEPVDLSISEPMLDAVEGPLSSSNQAVPYMIFFKRPDWLQRLGGHYDLSATKIRYYTALSYMATGGISRVFSIPTSVYRVAFSIDRALANALPRVFASFFVVKLVSASK